MVKVHRDMTNTAADMQHSGERFRRPGGVSWRESRGEWKRRSRDLYRAKNGRRQRLNSPAITRRKSSLSRAPIPAGGRRRCEVSGDVTRDPPVSVRKEKKKGDRACGCCWARWWAASCACARERRWAGPTGEGRLGLAGLFLFFLTKTFPSLFSKSKTNITLK